MKAIILFALFALAAAEIEYYVADDTLDINEIVSEVSRMKSFVDCYLDREPCFEPAATYKLLIPEALATKCERCTDKLKHLARGFLEALKAVLPEEYRAFRLKYDPEDRYFDDFEKAMEAY
ncbi:allergen Tha p 1-like isoform X2 [Maniola jurtina]|nr:allergen Tha p 1-like isoform X2 [Maniola jurtina]XP_045777526.1 allergen Tha p 1-like isoform X2 [Maniola jurtina]